GQDRHAGLLSDAASNDLVAKLFEDVCAGTDEDDTGIADGASEVWIFREKAVAGVDGVDLVLAGQRDDVVDIEVGANRFAGPANAIGLVGLEAVQRKAVLVRVESDVAQPALGAGAADAD